MNTLTKTVLASALFTVLLAGTSANAEGMAGDLSDYPDNSATQSVDIVKVSIQTPAATYSVNR